ncbi:MAG: hypothetical protein ACLPV8_16585 [Steroidobacteraceae bacterium]
MAIEGDLDYALARVAARHGQRLDEGAWRRLESSRNMAHYLAATRSTALGGWVSSIDVELDCHAVERALRVQWLRYVDGVAVWHPHVWQAWLAWPAWLPTLSLLAPLGRTDAVPGWLLADPLYGPIAPGTAADRATALEHTALAPLRPVLAGRTGLAAAWSAEWQALRPRSGAVTQHFLRRLMQAIEQHEQALLRAADSAEPQRRELADRLQRLFRAAAGTVIVTLCHLALVALDLERLRGGLARRCLFGDDKREHA